MGIESRGFILSGILAYRLNAGFVMIRKKGKLPGAKISHTYNLEYGTDTIEIHEHDLSKDDIVLLHDDLLATGGTVLAATQLLEKIGITQIHTDFLCELSDLGGRKRIEEKYPAESLVSY